MTFKQKYRLFCSEETTIPIFSQDWWLDLVTNGEWDVCLIENENRIIASMPFYMKKQYGFSEILMPKLTQNLGPWIRPSKAKYNKILSQQKNLMQNLIQQLPKYDSFKQNWHYSQKNWLPFFWKGFNASISYTYVIENLLDLNNVWNGMRENIKREIRKAKNKDIIVKTDLHIDDMLDLNKMTFNRQKKNVPYSDFFLKSLFDKAKKNNQCKWFIGQDRNKKNHAGVLIVWDEVSSYYLLGGGNPELRNSGATSLCMWEAIKFASTVSNKFDFEGSMIEPIERYFRGFGAVQKPYFKITHNPSKILKVIKSIKNLL